jgi:hypothetical protein
LAIRIGIAHETHAELHAHQVRIAIVIRIDGLEGIETAIGDSRDGSCELASQAQTDQVRRKKEAYSHGNCQTGGGNGQRK